jgi:hypothetical protein
VHEVGSVVPGGARMTFTEWIECKILRRHPGFYLATNVHPSWLARSKARSGNVLICVRCGGVS